MMGRLKGNTCTLVFAFLMIFGMPKSRGLTDPRDVIALNSLYASLGYPPLPGWLPFGGDPCGLSWQGVQCVNANVTGIVLSGANLGGVLSEDLGLLASIIQIDLSNNHIGGGIPSNLPITMRSFFLSGNQLTGGIPDALASLGQLTDLSLNDNHLTGPIADVFQQLKGLINMDLSGNSLGGQLPPSMGSLSSLKTLHLQNNQLIGTLNVLVDLPLRDLNVENNLFSGPVPDKLLSIPSFRRAGNPFNTTILPSPPAIPPSLSPLLAPSPHTAPEKPRQKENGPSASELPDSGSRMNVKHSGSNNITRIAIVGLVIVALLAIGLCFLTSRCCRRRKVPASYEMGAYGASGDTHKEHYYQVQKAKEMVSRPAGADSTRMPDPDKDIKRKASFFKPEKDHSIDMSTLNSTLPPPRPPTFPVLPAERITTDPVFPPVTRRMPTSKNINSAKFFTIAALQQYTNSFSQENLVGGGVLGTVYKAELPDGKVLAVKKLHMRSTRNQSDQDFLELVSKIARLKNANIVELVGYCLEHGQRLLVYEYCKYGTLYEALHVDDDIHRKLSWASRLRLALQAAKALEYLHEGCRPPIVHRNFRSPNILLDDELAVQVSDCGLAPLLSSDYLTQLQGSGNGAPELESGSYTQQSDVYSFGVVMLELLTGRKSYDGLRPRGEQYLVRWAIHRLHDIDALSRMVDPSLNGAYSSKSLSRLADIISMCIQPEPEFRPLMSEIVQNLLNIINRDQGGRT